MKLNKVFKKAMLASMTLLMAASLTFTGCSSSTGSDDDDSKLPGTDYVKTFKIEKNVYVTEKQTQVKIDTGIESFEIGDDIIVHMKGNASKKFAAELYIVDTNQNAGGKADSYWGPLTVKTADDDGKEVVEIPTEFDITKTFTITSKPAASASDVKFVINGTDGDETISIGCTEFSIKKDDKIKVTKVELSATSKDLHEGETFDLTATVSPDNATDKTVTWTSSDETIATIDNNGKVTAIKKGNVTITAKAGNKEATCAIAVLAVGEDAVRVTGVTLSESTKEIKVGEDTTLTATVLPANATTKAVTWSSSDETIAIVDNNGKVTGKKAGTAKITVTTNDGNKADECTVTVAPPAAALEFDFTTLGLSSITEKFGLVTWDSVSGEDKGSITAEGLVLDVSQSWDGAFKAAINSTDLSAVTKIAVEYKVSADWTYGESTNNKCNIMLVSEEDSTYKAVKVDLGDFAQAANNTSFTTEEITNIYAKTWDDCSGADKTKIIAIKINTMDGVGKITIKSIKFYN